MFPRRKVVGCCRLAADHIETRFSVEMAHLTIPGKLPTRRKYTIQHHADRCKDEYFSQPDIGSSLRMETLLSGPEDSCGD